MSSVPELLKRRAPPSPAALLLVKALPATVRLAGLATPMAPPFAAAALESRMQLVKVAEAPTPPPTKTPPPVPGALPPWIVKFWNSVVRPARPAVVKTPVVGVTCCCTTLSPAF